MMLIKEIAVNVNILNSRIKKNFFDRLQENGINITPEQYLVLDILWEKPSLSQQSIADIIQKSQALCKEQKKWHLILKKFNLTV